MDHAPIKILDAPGEKIAKRRLYLGALDHMAALGGELREGSGRLLALVEPETPIRFATSSRR
jgi:hypothetical protein